MTVLHLERHLVDPRRRDAHDDAIRRLLDAMRVSEGFLWADASRSATDPELVTVCGEWRSASDLDAFRSSEAYADVLALIDPCVRESPSVRRFESA